LHSDLNLFHFVAPYSFITREELEQALKEKGLYNNEEIKDVIADADADNVSIELNW